MSTKKPVVLAANTSGTIPSLNGFLAIAILLKPCAGLCKRLHQKINTNKSKSSSELLSVATS